MYAKCSTRDSIVNLSEVSKIKSKFCALRACVDSVRSSVAVLLAISSYIRFRILTQNMGKSPRHGKCADSICRLIRAVTFVNNVEIN